MNRKTLLMMLVAMLAAALVAAGCTDDSDEDTEASSAETTQEESMDDAMEEDSMEPETTIVEAAIATDSLSTLVTAVEAADLVETLSSEGPFTVFAPTNDAFAALPEGTLDTLLQPENQDQLAGILTYHVVPGEVGSMDLSDGMEVETVAGGMLTINVDGETVTITDENGGTATVAQADLYQSNGVVHVIDAVLLPAS